MFHIKKIIVLCFLGNSCYPALRSPKMIPQMLTENNPSKTSKKLECNRELTYLYYVKCHDFTIFLLKYKKILQEKFLSQHNTHKLQTTIC